MKWRRTLFDWKRRIKAISKPEMDNLNIWDLEYFTFSKLVNILDDDDAREALLSVLPPRFCSDEMLTSMKVASYKPNMTSGKFLLFYLGSRGVCVSDLVEYLEAANLQKALIYLKDDEPLQILDNPESFIEVKENSRICITCRATSFPSPEYQWFKGQEEQLLQQKSQLVISSARLKDSGVYICRVSSRSFKTGKISCIFSLATEVNIIPAPDVPSLPPLSSAIVTSEKPETSSQKPDDSSDFLAFLRKTLQICIAQCPNEKDAQIRIIEQPHHEGKVAQGNNIYLLCRAKSEYPCQYLWFCNGKHMPGETSSQLVRNHVFNDPESRELIYEYKCLVYNDYDYKFSSIVVIELEEAHMNTPQYAEEKVAFIVAMDDYQHLKDLEKPAFDAADLVPELSEMNFKVFALRNLSYVEMINAFHIFCKIIKPNSYVVFFFAGHGFEQCGQKYLLPVDCSENFSTDEAICSEYILHYLQERKPALNFLLIDICRKHPSQYHKCERHISGNIFKSKMGDNTVYGYSTIFANSAFESKDKITRNGFFVKHLKKHIRDNKKVQDMLMTVQNDFLSDPETKRQHPEMDSSLKAPRKLCDDISQTLARSYFDEILYWADIKRSNLARIFTVEGTGIAIVLEFGHHMGAFCNGVDISAFEDIKENASIEILQNLQMRLKFYSNEVEITTTEERHEAVKIGTKNLLFKKQVLNIHRLKKPLQGGILLRDLSSGDTEEIKFSIDHNRITELQLPVNRLSMANMEHMSICSSENVDSQATTTNSEDIASTSDVRTSEDNME